MSNAAEVREHQDAEMAVISSMMISAEAVDIAFEALAADDFARQSNKRVFETMYELCQRREPIDLLTVSNALKNKHKLDEVGGMAYLTAVDQHLPSATSSSVVHYVRIVREKSVRRQLLAVSSEIASLANGEEHRPEVLIDRAQELIHGIRASSHQETVSSLYEVGDAVYKAGRNAQELRYQNGGINTLLGIPTGYSVLDTFTQGLQPGRLYVLAGTPGSGKTSLAVNIGAHIAVRHSRPVYMVSRDMAATEIAHRYFSDKANVEAYRIASGALSKSEWQAFGSALDEVQSSIFDIDTKTKSVMAMRNKLRRFKREHGDVGLIVADYLTKLHPADAREQRHRQVEMIAQDLKELGQEFNAPVLCLAQLNRAFHSRENKAPNLGDLKESSGIEQEADAVVFIYRAGYTDEKDSVSDPFKTEKVELIFAKNRNGRRGSVHLGFIPALTKFTNLVDDRWVQPPGLPLLTLVEDEE